MFITLEGTEGAGKTTQLPHLVRFLENQTGLLNWATQVGSSRGNTETVAKKRPMGDRDWVDAKFPVLPGIVRGPRSAQTLVVVP